MANDPTARGTEVGPRCAGDTLGLDKLGCQVTLRGGAGIWAPAQFGQSKWRHQENLCTMGLISTDTTSSVPVRTLL